MIFWASHYKYLLLLLLLLLESLESEIKNLKTALHTQQEVTIKLEDKVESLNDQLDDQINRGLRSTLVFRGINKKDNETWDETVSVLASTINNLIPSITIDWMKKAIERAHRTNSSENEKAHRANSSPNIIVKFVSWKDSELVKHSIIEYNKKHTQDGSTLINVNQMYSKALQARYNAAMLYRKELIKESPGMSYIVKYPAKILGKKKGSNRGYQMLKEF